MRRTPPPLRWASLAVVLAGCLVLAGCSSGPPGVVSPPPSSGNSLQTALQKLGVNLTNSSRKSPTGTDLPSSYAPLGETAAYNSPAIGSNASATNPTDEILLAGVAQPSLASGPANLVKIENAVISNSQPHNSVSLLHAFGAGSSAWVSPSGQGSPSINANFQSLSSVASGDFDGDGLQELAIVYVAPPVSAGTDPTLKLTIVQDSKEGYASTTTTLMDAKGITDVAATAGDFNGDGTASLAIALAYSGEPGQLVFVGQANGQYQVQSSLTKKLPRTLTGSAMYFRLAAGSIDYDKADELGVVVNEFDPSGPTGASHYYVYDDANSSFKLLSSGAVGQAAGHAALAGDIALGDIDGDGLNEVVVGGPTSFGTNCNSYGQVVTAFDDAAHGFKTLGSVYNGNVTFAGCANNAQNPWSVYFTFVKTLDLNGNGVDSIVANQFLYQYSTSCPGGAGLCPLQDSSGTPLQLPDSVFLSPTSDGVSGTDAGAILSPTHAAVAVGDVTGDGRQNVVVDVQWHSEAVAWGISQVATVGTDGWDKLATIATAQGTTVGALRPELVPTLTEPSGPILKYMKASHQLVFTQPIVIAALSAPPCENNIGQNTGACATQFGKSTSSGTTFGGSVTLTAGATVGTTGSVGLDTGPKVQGQLTKSISHSVSLSTSRSYTVTKSVTYTTSAMKDGVVFTSIPEDMYVYKIVSAADPTLVGQKVEIFIPRTPVTLIADRSFYNSVVPSNELKIDSKVFTHKIGDVGSYPTSSQASNLVGAYQGKSFGPVTVGQGSGSTQVSISVAKQISNGGQFALSVQHDVQFTIAIGAKGVSAGKVAGFSEGYTTSASLTVTSGKSTTYAGTVGNIGPAANFKSDYYGYGMFTYVQALDNQSFEVVRYWVVPH